MIAIETLVHLIIQFSRRLSSHWTRHTEQFFSKLAPTSVPQCLIWTVSHDVSAWGLFLGLGTPELAALISYSLTELAVQRQNCKAPSSQFLC